MPDFTHRFLIGSDPVINALDPVGSTGGDWDHTHTGGTTGAGSSHTHTLSGSTDNESAHTHDVTPNAMAAQYDGGTVNTPAAPTQVTTGAGSAHSHGVSAVTVGGESAHTHAGGTTGTANPPFAAIYWIIKT